MGLFLNILSENLVLLTQQSFLWLVFAVPVVLLFILFDLLIVARRAQFLAKQKYVVLQIKVPRDVPKSPLAMEIVMNAFHQTVGESTWYDRIVLGKMRAHSSLEIVSIEGDVRFMIWTNARIQKFIETQIYSQYPNAEIKEVLDYTTMVPYAKEGSDWDLFAFEFKLTKPDPYPIKTYVDYNLDKDPKEEFKIDPMTPVLEFLGDIGRGEHAWFQIIVRANKGKKDPTTFWRNRDWQQEGKDLIQKIMDEAKERSGPLPEDATNDFRMSMLTEGDRNAIKAIDRNIGKQGFDCGIRALYLGRKDVFNPANVAGLAVTMKQYSSNDLNGFKPRDFTDVDYPWQKYINIPFPSTSSSVPFFSLQ